MQGERDFTTDFIQSCEIISIFQTALFIHFRVLQHILYEIDNIVAMFVRVVLLSYTVYLGPNIVRLVINQFRISEVSTLQDYQNKILSYLNNLNKKIIILYYTTFETTPHNITNIINNNFFFYGF